MSGKRKATLGLGIAVLLLFVFLPLYPLVFESSTFVDNSTECRVSERGLLRLRMNPAVSLFDLFLVRRVGQRRSIVFVLGCFTLSRELRAYLAMPAVLTWDGNLQKGRLVGKSVGRGKNRVICSEL